MQQTRHVALNRLSCERRVDIAQRRRLKMFIRYLPIKHEAIDCVLRIFGVNKYSISNAS